MIRSMTAFSRQQSTSEVGELVLEIRTVNHRYLDISPRMPEELRSLETMVREKINGRLSRGKVECNLRYTSPEQSGGELVVDDERVKQISHASRHIDSFLYNPAPISSLEVLRMPGVIQGKPLDQEQLTDTLSTLLDTALDDLIATREREGEKLARMILDRAGEMVRIVTEVKAQMPAILEQWREKLLERLREAKLELEPDRLEQEIVMLANKTDVAEEMDRLAVHIDEVKRVLEQDKPVGRRLDFLMQELNRETNTLGSKSINTDTTRASVDLKVLIEQMREQVQNIE
ncbi:MAG: YicC family protein [Proteobacteria bacterium]|nr:YicC family protein [Pseudomonadota bacterium]